VEAHQAQPCQRRSSTRGGTVLRGCAEWRHSGETAILTNGRVPGRTFQPSGRRGAGRNFLTWGLRSPLVTALVRRRWAGNTHFRSVLTSLATRASRKDLCVSPYCRSQTLQLECFYCGSSKVALNTPSDAPDHNNHLWVCRDELTELGLGVGGYYCAVCGPL